MPELEDDVEPDEPTGVDADESANVEVITDAAVVRAVQEKYDQGAVEESAD